MDLNTKQQHFLEAMLEQPSINKAAEKANISKRTAYKYLDDEKFKKELKRARRRSVENVTNRLRGLGDKAVLALEENLTDPESSPASRTQAARTIISYIYKGYEIENVIERLDDIEDFLENEKENE